MQGVQARYVAELHSFPLSDTRLYPFSYAPIGEGEHISGELFGLFWGFVCCQPLFETSDERACEHE